LKALENFEKVLINISDQLSNMFQNFTSYMIPICTNVKMQKDHALNSSAFSEQFNERYVDILE